MKQYTPIKVLIFSALFLANFSFFAMEKEGVEYSALVKRLKAEDVNFTNESSPLNEELFDLIETFTNTINEKEAPDDSSKVIQIFNTYLTILLKQGADPTGKVEQIVSMYDPAGKIKVVHYYPTSLENALLLKCIPFSSVQLLINHTTNNRLNSIQDLCHALIYNKKTTEDKLKIIDLCKKKGFTFKGKELLHKVCGHPICHGRYSNLEIAKKLVKDGDVCVDETDKNDNGPMHILAANLLIYNKHNSLEKLLNEDCLNEVEQIKDFLLAQGASLDAKNNCGQTPHCVALLYKDDKGCIKHSKQVKKFIDFFDPKQQ